GSRSAGRWGGGNTGNLRRGARHRPGTWTGHRPGTWTGNRPGGCRRATRLAAARCGLAAVWQARRTVTARAVSETALLAASLVATAGRGRRPVAAALAGTAAVECFLEPADHRRLDRRGRGTHELAHLFELGHDSLALYPELLCEFVNPDLRHYAPLLGPSQGPSKPDHQPIRCIGCSGPASVRAVHRLVLIERSLASRPAFRTGFRHVQRASRRLDRPAPFPSSTVAVSHVMTRQQHGKGTKLAARCQANPERAERERTPDAAAPVRSMPGWDASKRPCLAAALGGRARCRPRPPQGEAS
ncbi:MAG: hypothetical protein QOG28_5979, partial [Trebonia sp.]|nr:hypothetical protein [Trebonia sp.]